MVEEEKCPLQQFAEHATARGKPVAFVLLAVRGDGGITLDIRNNKDALGSICYATMLVDFARSYMNNYKQQKAVEDSYPAKTRWENDGKDRNGSVKLIDL